MKKFIVAVVCLVAALFVFSLQDPLQSDFQEFQDQNSLGKLPDADLRQIAEQNWARGYKDTAISILEYMIETGMGDASSAKVLKDTYLAEIKEDTSVIGKIRSAGYGFLTGKVDDLTSLSGSVAADFLIYGDLRDITRELVFEDETDVLIVALSTAGVVTTIFPPGEAAITVMKALKKVSALSEPMLKFLKTMLFGFKNLGNMAKIEKIKDLFVPFYKLFQQIGSWSGFTSIVRFCTNLDQLKMLSKLISLAPQNAAKVSRIISVAGASSKDLAIKVIDTMAKYGQKGMDSLYGALRKGPAGLRFIAEHPTLAVRAAKNVKKGSPVVLNAGLDKLYSYMTHYRTYALWIKYGVASFLLFIAIVLFVGLFQSKHKDAGSFKKSLTFKIIPAAGAALLFAGIVYFVSSQKTLPGQFADEVGGSLSESVSGMIHSHDMSFQGVSGILLIILLLLGSFIVNTMALLFVRTKITSINHLSVPEQTKLSMLENMDIYFDLPMYIGLAMTILSFIVITLLGAESARMLAYFSTLVGIGYTIFMRIKYLQEGRENIFKSMHCCEVEDSNQ